MILKLIIALCLHSKLETIICAGQHDLKYLGGLAVVIYMEHKAGLAMTYFIIDLSSF